MNDITSILLAAFGMIVTALATWIVNRVIKWLNAKTKNEETKKCLESIRQLVMTIVKSTTQTYVNNLKGTENWTGDAQKVALFKTLEIVKSLMSEELKKFIVDNFGDLEMWLTNMIEAQIYSLK